MWTNWAVAAVLMAVSVVLTLANLRSFQAAFEAAVAGQTAAAGEALIFARRQLRRRLMVNALLCFAGLAVFVGHWAGESRFATFYWCGVGLLVVVVLRLALADAVSSRTYLSAEQQRQVAAAAELRREIDRFRRESAASRTDGTN